jgi:signal transduction histidine kinase/streptogramin lyase
MWAALGRMGLAHFGTKHALFKRLPRDPGNPNGKVERFVGALYGDRQGVLWLGTPDALNRIDRKAGRFTSYHLAAGPASVTDVITIREDRSGNLWIGTYAHGLLRFDRRTGRFRAYRHDPADPYSLSDDIVSRLLVDHSGTLWVATGDGLNRFDAATEHFTTYKLDQQRRIQSYLDLVEDREGALWLGTDSSGLHRFDPATRRFTVYQHDVNRRDTLSDNRVNSVHFDRAGTMWVGTQDGLDKFDPKTRAFTVYMRPDGLPGNAVGCILEDDHGNLWMSTNNGVATFNPHSNSFKNYSTADGLPGPDLTGWGACSESAEGEMFFGGFSGATAFFPEKATDSAYVPRVILTDFRLFGIPVVAKRGSPLKRPINYTDAIILSHNQSIFSLGFSALSYFNAATNRYRYMLEGLDRRWNEVGSDQRFASYTTLPAGIYTLRVQAATSRGAWSEPGAELRIEILPPWWGTWWFKVSYAALPLLIGLAAYFYRLRQVERIISARFDERLAERTRVARDLHDTFLQTIQGSKLLADDALEPFADPIRMRRALERLSVWLAKAMEEGRAALNSLRTTTTETNDLAEALRRVTEDGLIPSSMAVTFSVIGDAREMHPIVRDEVYRIAYEAIRNACLHSGASRLEVELIYADDLALCVGDNGTGIDPTIADRGKDGHFGLQGMRERAARIGGKLTLGSSSNSGTEIKLIVPGGIIFRKMMPARRFLFTKIRTLFR